MLAIYTYWSYIWVGVGCRFILYHRFTRASKTDNPNSLTLSFCNKIPIGAEEPKCSIMEISLLIILSWGFFFMVLIPFCMCFTMADNRKINPWSFAIISLFIWYLSPIIMAIIYQTPKKVVERKLEIAKEYKRVIASKG